MPAPRFPTYLPGRFVIEPGTMADYHALARFHYRPGKPATVAGIWRVRFVYREQSKSDQLAGVGVLSYPVPCCRERNIVFRLGGRRYGEKLAFANRNLRTISRVIVHPMFRAAGVASLLVRHLCEQCPTRYAEALATMGRVHPFFERAGMTRTDPDDPDRPVYFHFDRSAHRRGRRHCSPTTSSPRPDG